MTVDFVKVWFQNRRTKHKRMQQEEEAKTSQGSNKGSQGSQQNNSHHVNKWKQETGDDSQYGEYIDMDMDEECVSDVESES
ncbi:Homeobox domain containing protein [Asbolus verrucosus]|uniref:Homeobox domain containing protein n=1 Tax=Asbolus verrucosus TaxID=1661398 RepID=A0A482VE31_ASBVE|nr:Homeobox domain containing protein [Asbolus verrucosus]